MLVPTEKMKKTAEMPDKQVEPGSTLHNDI